MDEREQAVDGVGVVVLTYGTDGPHGRLLDSLRAAGIPAGKVVVVHNPAHPEEPDPPLPDGCELVRADRNRGYAGGMNLGIDRWSRRGGGEQLLLLLTHDARLRQGALPALLETAERHPECAVFGPVLMFEGSDRPFSFGGVTSPAGATSHLKQRPVEVDRGLAPCDWVDGGTLLVRRDVFAAIGRFDERFWSYCEESDLCLRVRRAGRLVGVAVDAIADQDPGGAKRPGAWAYLLTRNGLAYARRAAGRRGLAARTGSTLVQIATCLARVAARGLRLRRGSPAEPWILAVGASRGTLDYFRGRWGPPPPGLPGIGDVANLGADEVHDGG
ncbi:MAG TPA: glycosyltransferase family 2 protein [Solirubrobacterales bacterium]|nr:glycosyltransferase family 2 protein [Solirubrobacterales bacterium]